MSIVLFSDSTANLTEAQYQENGIEVVTLTLSINDDEVPCYLPGAPFDSEGFYRRMREDEQLVTKTSMVNTSTFLTAFETHLKNGDDVLYVAMSGGISGTCGCAETAAAILKEKYPKRRIRIVDTITASIGQGILLLETAAQLRDGAGLEEAADYTFRRSRELHSYFMADDLNFLRRGGRLSGTAALAGSIMHLKPILKGNEEGKIAVHQKIIGRKKAIKTLIETFYAQHSTAEQNRIVGISHTGCENEAHLLAAELIDLFPNIEVRVVGFEPCTASHVGPDALGLFFF